VQRNLYKNVKFCRIKVCQQAFGSFEVGKALSWVAVAVSAGGVLVPRPHSSESGGRGGESDLWFEVVSSGCPRRVPLSLPLQISFVLPWCLSTSEPRSESWIKLSWQHHISYTGPNPGLSLISVPTLFFPQRVLILRSSAIHSLPHRFHLTRQHEEKETWKRSCLSLVVLIKGETEIDGFYDWTGRGRLAHLVFPLHWTFPFMEAHNGLSGL